MRPDFPSQAARSSGAASLAPYNCVFFLIHPGIPQYIMKTPADDKAAGDSDKRHEKLPEVVGLCLSGGGFRAATFHLGTLMYLHRCRLLRRVQRLSTVSGGTFTGARYALALVEQTPLEWFFQRFYRELAASRLLPEALALLGSNEPLGAASPRRNLVTCAAEVYARTLFQRDDGSGPYWFADLLDGDTTPLSEISFNATDFHHGLSFRFQKSATGGLIGNRQCRVARREAGRIRLADIVAASSCFPGGFEPLEFPREFAWRETDDGRGPPANLPSIPLMDGGVNDNQGLESLLLSRKNLEPPDALIVSDSDRREDELYAVPPPIQALVRENSAKVPFLVRGLLSWNPTLRALDRWAVVLLSLCLGSAMTLGANLWMLRNALPVDWLGWARLILLLGIPLVLTVVTALVLLVGRSLARTRLLDRIPQVQSSGWVNLRQLRLTDVIDLLAMRVTSLFALTSDVFMKRIRAAGYAQAYSNPDYKGRLIANFIYHLRLDGDAPALDQLESDDSGSEPPTSDGRAGNEDRGPFERLLTDNKMLGTPSPGLIARLRALPNPSRRLRETASSAAETPTLLWFRNDSEPGRLVATGQFTICFNLLKYLARTCSFDEASGRFTDPEVEELWQRLAQDWAQFQSQPEFLVPVIPLQS